MVAHTMWRVLSCASDKGQLPYFCTLEGFCGTFVGVVRIL